MMLRTAKKRRRGAQAVEAAIVITTFVTLVLGMIDLGMGVVVFNTVSHAARQGARRAIVHGDLSSSPWGTATYTGAGDSADAIPSEFRRVGVFTSLKPSDVTVKVEWLDLTADPDDQDNRVRVTISTRYQPMTTIIFGVDITASSTMSITH